MRLKIEAFLGEGDKARRLEALLRELESELADRVELFVYHERNNLFESYGLRATPAVVIEGMVKIQGVCPSKETLLRGLTEVGLE